MTLYIGLMSGTSMDGIDAALVQMPTNKMVFGLTKQYSKSVKQNLDKLLKGSTTDLGALCQLNTLIGREFALATNELLQEANISASDISAIGSHGQTVCHDTSGAIPYTLQLGCPHSISSLTGITVVADFRTRDLVNGGQGAPFAPLYHQQLFSSPSETVAVVNVGGISNISFLVPDKQTKGWDIGPGNCLMDAWIFKHHGKSYDAHGAWAKEGKIIQPLLTRLLADPFIALTPPKSIGKEYYSMTWLEGQLDPSYKPVDVQATLVAYTAQTIANTVLNNKENATKKLFLCGGGTHNTQLINTLSNLLPDTDVQSCAALGVSPDYLEAMMFAWLAAQTITKTPVNLSTITGSHGPQLLGAIYPSLKSY